MTLTDYICQEEIIGAVVLQNDTKLDLKVRLKFWSSVEYMCQEKRGEEDFSSLKTAWTHRYNYSKTTHKCKGEEWLQPPETILMTGGPAER